MKTNFSMAPNMFKPMKSEHFCISMDWKPVLDHWMFMHSCVISTEWKWHHIASTLCKLFNLNSQRPAYLKWLPEYNIMK